VVHVVGYRERDLGLPGMPDELGVAGNLDQVAVRNASSAALPGAGSRQIRRASVSADRPLQLKKRR
jgi:hypothetical protein